MVDNHLIFLVTILIHYGSNEGSLHGKAAKPSAEKGSEKKFGEETVLVRREVRR